MNDLKLNWNFSFKEMTSFRQHRHLQVAHACKIVCNFFMN